MENQSPTSSFSNIEFKIVVYFGMVMIILNGICTLYVLRRTLTRWIISKKSLPMALRVPFYISLSDFMLFSINFPNMLFPVIHGVPWSNSNCKIIGGITFFTISTNITLVGLLAFLTYLRICRKMIIDLGKYDYKAILFILFTSIVYTMISLPSYGSGKYWCYTNKTSNILPIVTLILNFGALAITLFSYSLTLREINSISFINDHNREREKERERFEYSNFNSNTYLNRNYVDGNTSNNNENVSKIVKKIEPIVVRKIIGYVLIFMLQWTPPMIYVVGQIIDYDPLWVYLITDASVNMGGIGNMIQFIINEGWKDPYVPPQKRTSTSSSIIINTPHEPFTQTPLHLLPQINNSTFEVTIKVETNTEVSKSFSSDTSKPSTVTIVNTDNEHFTNNEETRLPRPASSKDHLI
ncbi:17867_t:CDS:2 [Funneliformis caledonium]|uniref:17867_t:CDS:1 n=1 Tax=Funneliformis caledonium TaxID=1117310 RepID=A0A9N9DVA0_9GLOM|nr:17867_t:CDS:2 [Funneliformis caledonium]